jgi:hypothetical protein
MSLARDKPATPKDVRDGQALFLPDGEGETRVVAALDARWATRRNRPSRSETTALKTGQKTVTPEYRQTGPVVQAEEARKEGQWQRYYGFSGSNHPARDPAGGV